ncbi:MAG TPA: P-loop NTPase fold protein [Phycisphaerae bacterium]|nr:P-loop NTPase fold protein [Phycisphaerae bacterium]
MDDEVDQVAPLSDSPEPNPQMGFGEFADTLARMIRTAGQSPLTIGVFGRYGSGKTTLINAIADRLRKEQGQGSVVVVRFDAWRYDHEPHLFLPFLARLAKQKEIAGADGRTAELSRAFRSFLAGFTLKFPVFDFSSKDVLARETELKQLEAGDLARLTSAYEDITQCLRKLTDGTDGTPRRIVVFIDDLDRCLPGKAFALLEAIKAMTDIPGFAYVLGLDPRAISTYVIAKYGTEFVAPKEYLEKMFQVPFHLPRPTSDQIAEVPRRLLADVKSRCSPETWSDEMLSILEDKWDRLPANVRQVKRILNTHHGIAAARAKSEKPVNMRVLFGLLLIQTRWPGAYWVIQTYRRDFHRLIEMYDRGSPEKKSSQLLQRGAGAKEDLQDKGFQDVYKSFVYAGERPTTTQALELLDWTGWPIDVDMKLKEKAGQCSDRS